MSATLLQKSYSAKPRLRVRHFSADTTSLLNPLPSKLAAVDLGSNSFRLLVGRLEGEAIYPLQTLKEPVQLGAGLDLDCQLSQEAWDRAVACLARFGERLRGMHPQSVRVVATNTFRVAKNIEPLLPEAEAALGFPIEIISGREEGRLIYLGVVHHLPPSSLSRLVIDIGGGSTEFVIGQKTTPHLVESLKLGSVSWSLQFFADGKISKRRWQEAEVAARSQIEEIVEPFRACGWQETYGSSGTSRALMEVLEKNGLSQRGITLDSLAQLKDRLLTAGHVDHLKLVGLRPERAILLAAGAVLMTGIMAELGIDRVDAADGALRAGVLYDLLGRVLEQDVRIVSVARLVRQYTVDEVQGRRVKELALSLFEQVVPSAPAEVRLQLGWAAELHELGMAVSHHNYHKHSAYIFANADLPGFSTREQEHISALMLAQRGNLRKIASFLQHTVFRAQVLSLRLASIFYHNRREALLPALMLSIKGADYCLELAADWLEGHPMTSYLLQQEESSWQEAGYRFRVQPASID